MKLSRLVNKGLAHAGLQLTRVPAQPAVRMGNAHPLDGSDQADVETCKLLNLLAYTKSSGSSYSAQEFPSGYHTLRISGHEFKGQRDPNERLKGVPFEFEGASVLDLGCNQGGMLFSVADRIKAGVGIDFDPRMVNAANRIARHCEANNLDFYVFDLDGEDLQLLRNFLPEKAIDIVFLLSVCMWLSRWTSVIDFARSISNSMLFESNGSEEQQREQEAHLRSRYGSITKIRDASTDDAGQPNRRLFLCRA